MNLRKDLQKINTHLDSEGIKLRVEQRGDKLNLRGPLPCRSQAKTFKVQRISLNINATPVGLKEAQKIVELVVLQLHHNQFNWDNWIKKKPKAPSKKKLSSVLDAVQSFEEAFFYDSNRRRTPAGTRTTWTSAYLPYLRRLMRIENSQGKELGLDLLFRTLSSYSEDSRSRQQCGTALGAFANHLEIQLPDEWKIQANGYGLHKARFRRLPNDSLITESWLKIPNKRWKLAYGLMATYGLRNHEIFFSDLSSLSKAGDKVIRVLPITKTGEHQVWPFHPEWVELYELEQLAEDSKLLPSINTDLTSTTLQQVGRRVTEQFRRYELPLTPYNLRHAWAIRTIHIGLPDTVSARMMGHSVAIHNRTYHHWITRRDQQQAVDTALARTPCLIKNQPQAEDESSQKEQINNY